MCGRYASKSRPGIIRLDATERCQQAWFVGQRLKGPPTPPR